LVLIVVLIASPALGVEVAASAKTTRRPIVLPTEGVRKAMALAAVGTVIVYIPADLSRAKRVVLFLSGDGGWQLGVVDMTLRLAPCAVVAGNSLPPYQRAEKICGVRGESA
jgi:hypothetical protein